MSAPIPVTRSPDRTRHGHIPRRRGAIVVLAAAIMVVLIGMLAFSVDLGYNVAVQTELKRAADSGALAGVGLLVNGVDEAVDAAKTYAKDNKVGAHALQDADIQVEAGVWDQTNRTFGPVPAGKSPGAIKVTASNLNQPYYFARIFGRNSFNTTTESVAVFQPRDIMLVLDYSGSMSDDSELKSKGTVPGGQPTIEANLLQMYGERGSPQYGNMTFAPQFVTLTGHTPANSNQALIHVEFRSTSVYVTSTKTISSVRLHYSGDSSGTTSNFTTSGTAVTVTGSSSKTIDIVWVKSGTYDSNNPSGNGERFEDTYTNVKNFFNMGSVAYPYAGGSWNEFIDYVKTNSNVKNAGYKKKYGYLTWINYLMESRGGHSDTADLWKTSEQPLTAVKDAVDVFISFMQQVQTDDRVGFAIYTSTNGTALVETYDNGEQGLTKNLTEIATTVRKRQAGHYQSQTNIGAGIKSGRDEIVAKARPNSAKLIVLMTDGLANLPSNTSQGVAYTLSQAQLCADAGIPIVTISLGAGADTSIMQQVADLTGGVHFNVPGGQSAQAMSDQLKEVFKKVAGDHPLQLVK